MIPSLPTDSLHEAMAEGRWDVASDLLAEHGEAVRRGLERGPVSAQTLSRWQELLARQLDLLAQLQAARESTGQRLRELAQQRRGMNAYLRGVLE